MEDDPLLCLACGRTHAGSERFCAECGTPLVHEYGEEHVPSERQRVARKIKPQYTNGPLVELLRAGNQPQAEFIANLLLEEGIPCMIRNPLAGYSLTGEHIIVVPESAVQAAREALALERPES
ncbi:MAG TPA: DUF2007 domain-containing protein [Solirubrobacteraceae bacterium]|jgi:hypothetical protein